ncbi:hypothetical protein E3P99_03060 [Wallemia hederae]|uniref:Uncharacterized protein n=1 Tax=Wallemia hederae TaxID=1540922 RepID=A0A4T0FI36_9BASI|nr:hypothetical protein E3P99_03060 [Wallemia hederae]
MNTIDYQIPDLGSIKYKLDFIAEVNILTLSEVPLPLCEYSYYTLNDKLVETLRGGCKYNRILSFNRKIDNYCLTRGEGAFNLNVNASKAINNFYTGREGRIVKGEDYYKIDTDSTNIKLIGRLPKLPALATSRRSLEGASQSQYLRYYLNDVRLPTFRSNIADAFNWLNITLLRFSEARYSARVKRIIEEYTPPVSVSDKDSDIVTDLALHQWRGGLLDSDEVYSYLRKLPNDAPIFIQIKGFSHAPSAWKDYKDYKRFHSHKDTPTQTIVCCGGKFAVCDEYSINAFKR